MQDHEPQNLNKLLIKQKKWKKNQSSRHAAKQRFCNKNNLITAFNTYMGLNGVHCIGGYKGSKIVDFKWNSKTKNLSNAILAFLQPPRLQKRMW